MRVDWLRRMMTAPHEQPQSIHNLTTRNEDGTKKTETLPNHE